MPRPPKLAELLRVWTGDTPAMARDVWDLGELLNPGSNIKSLHELRLGHYPGIGAFHVPARRLVDLWRELYRYWVEVEFKTEVSVPDQATDKQSEEEATAQSSEDSNP